MRLWRRSPRPLASPLEVAGEPSATLEPPAPAADPPLPVATEEPGSVDGLVWVEGGRLHVRNPQGLGRWPSVLAEAAEGVRLTVNGVPASGEVVLRAEDDTQVQATGGETEGGLEVSVSEDGLSAWALLHPSEFSTVSLPDVPPANQIRLAAFARQETRPHGLGAGDVRRALAEAGVRAGIDEAALPQAMERAGQRTLVARGRAPLSGTPARLWSVLHGWVERPGATCSSAAARAQVGIGEPVAQLVPATAGHAGLTVTGEVLSAPEVWRVELVPGEGVLLSADGRTAISGRPGHPHVRIGEVRVECSVRADLQLHGDIEEGRGTIAHDGDVWVGGSVQAGGRVRATGDVEVGGRALRCQIDAGGDLEVRGGAAYAVLTAGGPGLLYAQILPLCERVEGLVRRRIGGGHVPPREVAGLVAKIEGLCADAAEPFVGPVAALREALVALGTWATGDTPPRNEAAVLTAVQTAVSAGLLAMRPALDRPGRCSVSHLDNTRVEASGDVEIGEAGALRSQIVTLGRVHAHGPFRGGSVLALGGARFLGLGPAGDVPVRVQLGERGEFRAREVFPGTVVTRGAVVRRFDAPERHVVWAAEGEGPEGAGRSPTEGGGADGSAPRTDNS